MSLRVGEVKYEDAQACLRDLMRMIRVGFPLDRAGIVPDQKERVAHTVSVLTKQKKQIADTISALKKEVTTNRALSETDRLRLVTLEAEYYQQRGTHLESARVLEPVWKRLKPRLDVWSVDQPLEPSGNRELLRQKIWALLHYVFYHHYRVTAQHKEALNLFRSIESIILSELKAPDYCPYGTLALCNYFIGLCYRVNRGFVEAERRMLAAQMYTYERVAREIKRSDITEQQKQYELDYKDLFSARVLSGLGWIAFQQGQLLRAEQHLCTAQSCMAHNRQETIGLWVDSLLWMVVRRRTAYDDPGYQSSLDELSNRWSEASGIHDLTRQRCAFELVRGYLDLAEFGSDQGDRQYNVKQAQHWLGKVGESSNAKAQQRYDLHHIRLLIVKGDIDAADAKLRELRVALLKGIQHHRQRAVLIMEATVYIAQGDFDTARDTVKKALAEILPLASSEALSGYRIPDPVLEAQCYVLLAQIYSSTKDYPAARHYLSQWSLLSQFVDNHYLHHLAKKVVTTQIPFQLEYEYPIFDSTGEVIQSIMDRTKSFEKWLRANAEARVPKKELARIYGRDASTVSRRRKKLAQDRE